MLLLFAIFNFNLDTMSYLFNLLCMGTFLGLAYEMADCIAGMAFAQGNMGPEMIVYLCSLAIMLPVTP